MRTAYPLFALCVLSVLIPSCSVLPIPQTPAPEVPPGTIIFHDDFSSAVYSWQTWHEEDGSMIDYQDGSLRFLINKSQHDYRSELEGSEYSDVILEVVALKLDGPNDNSFGLICRHQDGGDFYSFLITSDGYFGILKVKDNQYTVISGEELQFSEVIQRGMAINKIQAACIGSNMVLYVNGVHIAIARDTDFSKGNAGLIAGTFSTPGVDIMFDDFTIIQP